MRSNVKRDSGCPIQVIVCELSCLRHRLFPYKDISELFKGRTLIITWLNQLNKIKIGLVWRTESQNVMLIIYKMSHKFFICKNFIIFLWIEVGLTKNTTFIEGSPIKWNVWQLNKYKYCFLNCVISLMTIFSCRREYELSTSLHIWC